MAKARISYNSNLLHDIITSDELQHYNEAVANAETALQERSGPGNDFLGWLDLPVKTEQATLAAIQNKAGEVRDELKVDVLICIGIGGSYAGSKAAIEFLSPSFETLRKPQVLFAGHVVNSDYMADLLEMVKDKSVAVNIISKSGTTTEPGIAFRHIREWMLKRYGHKETAARIIATTDDGNGALRKFASDEGYATFNIPKDVGGRFSVLTPVGLFPIAVAGIAISDLIAGAADAMSFCKGSTIDDNMAGRYAAVRNILFKRGYTTEVLANFQPQFHSIGEWWKQLAGESEGKNKTGIFPATLDYPTDLHSMGQWMQDGMRNVFETFMVLKKTLQSYTVPKTNDDGDGLNYLAGKTFETVNEKAFQGTLLTHIDGGVPSTALMVDDRSARTLGQLFYFFEKAIALSGYILRINPFDQPGVEGYKKNMFALLGKKGSEALASKLSPRIMELGL